VVVVVATIFQKISLFAIDIN